MMPFPYPSYPGADDIKSVYTDLGITLTDTVDLWTPVKAAVQWWKDTTGWDPFLAETLTLKYDPPGGQPGSFAHSRGNDRILNLTVGLLALTSLSVNGATKTKGADFWLRPQNAIERGRPCQWIEFAFPTYGPPESVVMVGSCGYSDHLEADAFKGICDRAALYAAPQVISLIDHGMISWTDGDTSETYGQKPLENQIAQWEKNSNDAAGRYGRIPVGM